ncbi:MAG TPA: glutamate racemase [Methylomirabilota bacterium]|nr:glutamate racemase [Methylomirabilota bacterium]
MRIIVFDSGVGGLSVARAIRTAMPGAAITYLADTAVFPYGALEPDVLTERVVSLMERLAPGEAPVAVVIACNTASTLVLPPLRAMLSMPVVGTVPAIKPAAETSRSRLVSVLATPATVRRDYTRALIAEHGQDCRFTLVGARLLAGLVERQFNGETIADRDFAHEIAPCFVEEAGARTDTVVLACTHYPLVVERLNRVAPWPVAFIDPAPAIARRVLAVTVGAAPRPGPNRFLATGPAPSAETLSRFGFPPAEPWPG